MESFMIASFLDPYQRVDSLVHRLPIGVKLAGALGLVLTILWLPLRYWPFFVGASLALVVVVFLSRIPAGFLIRRMIWLEPVVAGMAVLALFQPQGGWIFLRIMVKSSLCLLTLLLLSNTTPFSGMIRLLQQLRVPSLLVTTLALMYRYLFVLVDEAERMKRARSSRTFSPQRVRQWQSRAAIIGQLFVRSSERAERIYAAMCARGWKG
jgi:cobalt/nickel transport system permease protein